jgi:hypothetical protein
MGAEREDTDPSHKRAGTEPGLGKASGASPAAAAVTVEDDAPPPVDFDALHAALGDPVEYDELSSGPAVDQGDDSDELLDGIEASAESPNDHGAGLSESSGRSSATYSSARPRTIPPTRAPVEDPNAPAVIVASDTDTVPSAPPQMTVPLKAPPPFAGGPPNVPGSNPHVQAAHAPSGPHGIAGQPSSGPQVASHPFTPHPFPARGAAHMTMRMPDRPVVNPRRAKTPTIVMRVRGPSAKQKLAAFMGMLVLVTACGIAVIIWRKPRLLGLDPLGAASASASALPALGASSAGPSGASGASSASAAASAASAAASAGASASPASSAKKVPKLAPVPPHPAASVLR